MKKKGILKRDGGIIHLIASCEDCPWKNEDYISGQERAREHELKKQHNVNVEIGKGYQLQGIFRE